MALTNEQVDHIAKLARISISDDERADFGARLSNILDWIAQLSEVDVDGVEEMTHSVDVRNVLREDGIVGCDVATREALIEAFPDKEEDLLRVKAVF